MDFGETLLAVLFGLDVAVAQGAFEGDELALLQRLGEPGELTPSIDAVPLGAGLVFAPVVLPDLLGGEVEDGELAVVLGGLGFRVLSEAADEGDLV